MSGFATTAPSQRRADPRARDARVGCSLCCELQAPPGATLCEREQPHKLTDPRRSQLIRKVDPGHHTTNQSGTRTSRNMVYVDSSASVPQCPGRGAASESALHGDPPAQPRCGVALIPDNGPRFTFPDALLNAWGFESEGGVTPYVQRGTARESPTRMSVSASPPPRHAARCCARRVALHRPLAATSYAPMMALEILGCATKPRRSRERAQPRACGVRRRDAARVTRLGDSVVTWLTALLFAANGL
jgi:hypothetical protein